MPSKNLYYLADCGGKAATVSQIKSAWGGFASSNPTTAYACRYETIRSKRANTRETTVQRNSTKQPLHCFWPL